ncbi:SE1832 family protein [Sporosarcina ureae]|uniref:SE1832 family protein n=1 Tax=Sporosarcina ureae TaxID=1571 RepID=UPI0026EB9EE3|nr:SE1832 family protein [Sporosarcina ureae]
MTKEQLEQEIAELKMDYISLQGDMEKLESTGHVKMIENAELRLSKMEERLADLNKQLAEATN